MNSEQPAPKESPPEINWVHPDIQSEIKEIERVAKMISGSEDHHDKDYQKTIQEITKVLETASFEELTDDMWSALENTDSYHDVRPGHIEDAQEIAKSYNRDPQESLDRIKNRDPFYAPIILILEDDTPHLVSGNTRLMIARALKLDVKVLIARLKESP